MKKAIFAGAILLAFTITAYGQQLSSIDNACKPRAAIYGPNQYQCDLPSTILKLPRENRGIQLTVTGPEEIRWQLFSIAHSPLFTGEVTNIVIVVNETRRWEIPTTRTFSRNMGRQFAEMLGETFDLNVTRDVALEIASAKTVTIEAGTERASFPAIWQSGIKDAVDYMDRIRSGKAATLHKPQFESRDKGSSCSLSDIEIKVVKAKFENVCRTTECWRLKGVAVLTNRCSESLVIEAKIIGYGPGMKPLATRDFYPANSNSIPPGEFIFSLDGLLDYDSEIYVFYVKAIGGRVGQ